MVLTKTQREKLVGALKSAFFNKSALQMMVSFKLGENLDDLAEGDNHLSRVFNLVRWAESEGRLQELLEGAREHNPGNPVLKAYFQEFHDDPTLQPQRVLERWIRASSKFFEPAALVRGLAENLPRVCRVEVGPSDFGTGFLVASDVVMTNYHVVEAVIQNPQKRGEIRVVFDYHRSRDGQAPTGENPFLLKVDDWLIDCSPYSQSDLSTHPPVPPSPAELDYALLRVDGTPGKQKVMSMDLALVERGWIALPEEDVSFPPNAPLFILQHPEGEPLQLTLEQDAILGVNANYTRVRYRTSTLPGSSGSPCFDAAWQPVALHHSGDPNYQTLHQPTYNQGIPLPAIRALLKQRGKEGVLAS